jgi:hypothetical protein
MDRPEEFCREYYRRAMEQQGQFGLWDTTRAEETEAVEAPLVPAFFPDDKDKIDFPVKAPPQWIEAVTALPEPTRMDDVIGEGSSFDLYIEAMGFEERTAEAAAGLASMRVKVHNVILLEFDTYYEANEKRRERYQEMVKKLTGGQAHRPLNAPVGVPDNSFPDRLKSVLRTLAGSGSPRILFDCSSCPSLILSETLSVLLNHVCDLTIFYSEAAEYSPALSEWESGKLKPSGTSIEGPFAGVRFVAKPPVLQADDIGERPVLLVLFPTFNTERTDGVLAELDPAARIWLFGEPHDLSVNSYRIEMAKAFAAPIMYPGDPWSVLSTFDYRRSLLALAGIYADHRFAYRIAVMPHGSKMQTLGASLFAAVHEVSSVFALPKTYDTERYSKGCLQVWAVPLGETQSIIQKLRAGRTLGIGKK